LLWLEMYLLSKLLIYPMMDRPLVVGRLATEQVGVASEERITRNKRRD